MKAVLFSLFVALAVAAPTHSSSKGEPVELIVNGVPEGTPLELSDIVDVKVHDIKDGEIVAASDLLYPLTAQGLAEAAAAAAANEQADNAPPEITDDIPETVALPAPAIPEVVPEPVDLPAPAAPEVVPEAIVMPAPAIPEIVPEPVALPAPALPEIVPEPVVLPAPGVPEVVVPSPPASVVETPLPEVPVAPTPTAPNGEIYNDGIVSVTVNTAHAAVSTTMDYLQSLYSVVINYFYNGKPVGQQNL